MPKATCRCGHKLDVPADGSDRIVCAQCGAKIRVRRGGPAADGFIRFACPCGRRLKVKVEADGGHPSAGKCPECGRVVPVPSSSNASLPTSHPEAPTVEMDAADVAQLEDWARVHLAKAAAMTSPAVKAEAGLRVCPRCGRPVHLGAVACRECGTHVPKR
jgi:DNA-directed RNA polymerase subunit M/transcription elongation factor TFIIS